MKILGIDNGLDGGMVQIGDGQILRAVMLTMQIGKKREYDMAEIHNLIIAWNPDHAIIEAAQAMPGQGVSSMFSIGKGFGIMLGLLTAHLIPFTIVRPQTWQKVIFRDMQKLDTKAASALIAKRLWPNQDWRATKNCKKTHDGLTDAACMAEYGRRLLCESPTQKREDW